MLNRPVHFEIQADDTQRAIGFYKNCFGWEFEEWKNDMGEYHMIMTAPKDSAERGINGGLLKRPAPVPMGGHGTNAYVCTMQVEDFDAVSKKILENGGQVALPKFAFPGMAWQGYFLDTEGNTFGLHQTDPNAK
jgi:uncharacterized protein